MIGESMTATSCRAKCWLPRMASLKIFGPRGTVSWNPSNSHFTKPSTLSASDATRTSGRPAWSHNFREFASGRRRMPTDDAEKPDAEKPDAEKPDAENLDQVELFD